MQNKCNKCGKKKATKLGEPNSRGADAVQRVRCDYCNQIRFNVIKPFPTPIVTGKHECNSTHS